VSAAPRIKALDCAIAAAPLAKGSLTGDEAHRIFNRANWPAVAQLITYYL
jgi:hypothetical protein